MRGENTGKIPNGRDLLNFNENIKVERKLDVAFCFKCFFRINYARHSLCFNEIENNWVICGGRVRLELNWSKAFVVDA